MKKLLLFIIIFCIKFSFSQQAEADIEIIHFNSSASYTHGSGISIHINPRGIYKLGDTQNLGIDDSDNNSFILELSSVDGTFENPYVLATVYDFYTPLINAVIPSSISAGNYKLRVKSTLGLESSAGVIDFETSTDYGVIYSEEIDIQISDEFLTSGLILNNLNETDLNVFNCLTEEIPNPSIGSLIVSSESNSSEFTQPTIYITDFESNNLIVTLYDILNNNSQNIATTTIGSAVAFDIPENLEIGTYTIEVQEILDSEFSNFSSFSFLWHRNSTSLTNLDNEEICVGSDVGFIIATDSENGVGGNYNGSYYSLDFGDSTNPIIFTHAFLLFSNQFSHEFTGASCLLEEQNEFEVTKLLYNKKDCSIYDENGQGKTTSVKASIPPVPNFDMPDQYCINPVNVENLVIFNETDLGLYGSTLLGCFNSADYSWSVKKPGATAFQPINNFSYPTWTTDVDVNGDNLPDLVIPDSDLSDLPGCWDFRMSAENDEGALCNSGVFAEGTVQVLSQPIVDFNIQDLSGNIVTEICPGDTVTLNNLTDAIELECQDLNFIWDINPTQPAEIDNHCSFISNTNPFSESPIVTFNEPGVYEITLTVTNGVCETQTFSYPFTVQGTPGVSFNANGGTQQACLDDINISNPYIVDFSTLYSPQYTAEPFEPNSFSWAVTGEGITEDDYSFVDGSSSASNLPVIEFYSFECYNISVSVDSSCENSSTDSFTLSIDQNPIANFEILNTSAEVVGLICPGDIVQLNDLSEISGDGCQNVTYQWGISALVPGTPAQHCAPATGSTWTDPSPYIEFIEPGVFEISVQVTAGNCPVDTYTDTIIVEGPPSVSIDVNGESSDQICLDSISDELPHTVDFSQTYTPSYSNDVGSNGQSFNSPSNYIWEINGDEITSNDYAYVNGTTSSSALPEIDFYSFGDYTITTTVEGNCNVSDENIFIYSINEIPSITNPDSDFEQTICSGEFTELLEFSSSVENTTFTWSFSTADTFLSGYNNETTNTGNLSTQNIFNDSNIPGQVIFQVTPSTVDCEGETKLVIITVNPEPQINNFSETICNDSAFSNISPINGINGDVVPAGTTYSWTAPLSNPINAITGGSPGTDQQSILGQTLFNETNSPAVLTYTITPSTSDDCEGDPFIYTVTVNPTGQVEPVASQVVCNGDLTTVDFNTNNSGGDTTYAWASLSDLGSGLSGTGNISFTAVNNTTDLLESTFTVTPTFTNAGVSCVGPEETFTITVTPTAQVNDLEDIVLCNATDSTEIVFTTENQNGTTLYTWSNDTPSINLEASGTGNIASFNATNTTTAPVIATVTVTPKYDSILECVGPSKTFTITVNPTGQVEPVASQVVCNGDLTTVDFTTDNTVGITSYTWSNTGGVDINIGTGATINDSATDITFTAVNESSEPISTEITVTPTFTNAGVSCVGPEETFTITVNPTTNVTPFDDQYIFTTQTTSPVTITSITSGTTFEWDAVADTGLEGLTNTSSNGNSNQIPAETLVNDTSGPLEVVYIITPTSPGDSVCPGNPYTYTVIVNPVVGMLAVDNQIICTDEITDEIVFSSSNSGGSTSYSWIASGDDIGFTQTDDGSGIIEAFTGVNQTLAPLVATITVTPTFENGGVSNIGTPITFTITVNPVPQINNVIETICNAATFSTVSPVDGLNGNFVPTGTTYSWIDPVSNPLNVVTGGSSAINQESITGQTLLNLTSTPATLIYTVTPTSSEGCPGNPFTVTINVNPEPQINNFSETICNDSAFSNISPINGINGDVVPAGTTYSWTAPLSNPINAITGGSPGTDQQSILGQTLFNETNSPAVLTYTITPSTSDDCEGDPFIYTVTVNPTGQVEPVASQVVCNGDLTTVDFNTNNSGGDTTYAWASLSDLGSGLSGTGNISFTAVNNTTDLLESTFTVTPTFTNAGVSCVGPEETFTITVTPTAQVNDLEDIVLCNATDSTEIVFTTENQNGTTLYTWSNDTPSINLEASGTGNIASFNATNTTTAPVIATVTVTPKYDSILECVGPSKTFTITVNPTGQVEPVASQVVCNGDLTTVDFTTDNTVGITSYTWSNTGGVDINIGTGATINDSATDITFTAVNESSEPISTEITVTPTFTNAGVSCVGPEETFTITVNPTTNVTPFDDLFIFTAGSTETVTIESITENTTFTWSTTVAAGIQGLVNTTGNTNIIPMETLTLAEGINTPLTVVYTIIPSTSVDQACPGNPYTYTVTVNPITGVTLIDNIVVCHNTPVGPIEFLSTVEGGTTTYEWEASGDNINLTQTDDGTGVINLFIAENLTSEPLITTITVIPTLTNGNVSSIGESLTFTITVNPTAQVDQPDNYGYCAGDTAVIDFTTSNTGANSVTTYSWVVSGDDIGLDASIEGDISQQTINETTETLTAVIEVTPTYTNAGEQCTGPSKEFTITVSPTAQVNAIAPITYCKGEVVEEIVFSTLNTSSTTVYNWTNDNTSIGLGASGTTDIPSFIAANDTNNPVISTITVTPSYVSADPLLTCDGPTETFTITVNPTAQVDQPDNYGYCAGDTAVIDFTTSNTGANSVTTYSWVVSGDDIGLDASIEGDISQQTINETTETLTAVIEVTPTYTNAGEQCTGPSKEFTITVSPTAQVNAIAPITYCKGEVVEEIVFSTLNTSSTTVYNWTNDNTSIGLGASGTTDIPSFIAANDTNNPVISTITVTPSYVSADPLLTCDGPTETFTITVNPTAQVDQPDNYGYCAGDTAVIDFTTSNTGANSVTTYSWVVSGDDIGLDASIEGDISQQTINETTETLTAVIEVTPTYTNAGEQCTGPSKEFTITVSPTAQVNAIAPITYCKGEVVEEIVFSTLNTSSTTVYNWTNDNTSIGLGASGTTDIPSFIAANDTNNPVISTITVTPSYVSADPLLTCDGPTETFTITVNPTAEMNDPVDMIVCDEDITSLVEFTTNNQGSVTTYSWTNDNPNIGLSTSGLGDLSSFTAINTGTEPIVAIVEVTPSYSDDINCDGISQTFTITVNPSAQVDAPQDQLVCNGDELFVVFSTQNTIGITSYTWNSDIDFGNGLNGEGNIDFTAINNGTFPIIANITVTPSSNENGITCSGPSQLFSITVNGNIDPEPTISNYNGFQISCFEANDGFINLSPAGGIANEFSPFYSYLWTGPNNFTSNNQNIENLEPGIYNLTISDSVNCSFDFEYEINEPELLEIFVDNQSNVQCNGVFDGIISVSATGGIAPYSFEWVKDGIFYSNDQNIENLETGTYELFLNDSNSCGPVSQVFEINQPDSIEIFLETSIDILCFGENTGSIDVSVIGGTPEQISTEISVYNYSWTGPNGYNSIDADIFNLFTGVYNLIVTDSLGCEEFFEVELTEPEDLIINFSTTDNSCYESNDGTINLDIQGGNEPYQIFWSNFGNGPVQTNLSAGIYEATVIDALNCEEIINIEILEAPIFDTDPLITNISCFGADDGSIDLNIIGGIGPVFVVWDDDPTAAEQRDNLVPGTYNVIIEDSSGNNCTIMHEFIIIEPLELSLSSIIESAIDCENVNSGSIDLQITGGTAPYTFQWNSGQINEDLENIGPGNYSVIVTDSKDCEISDSFSVYRQEDITTSLDITFEADCENDIPYQITTINIEGGVAPYEIIWSSGEVSGDNNETMTSSQNGTVIVDVIDSLGCQTQQIFDIDLFSFGSPGFNYSSPALTECDILGVGDIIQFTNTSTGDYISVDWNFQENGLTVINEENPTYSYSQPGIYVVTQTVYYESGCVDVFEDILYVTNGYGLVLPNAFTPNGDGINDTIRPWYKCMTNVEISIYDTFGSLLYVESGEDIYGWNGLIDGKMAENGNYIIVVKATTLFGEIINLNGPITLIR